MLKKIALEIAQKAIETSSPEVAVKKYLELYSGELSIKGKLYVLAVGKAAWRMANASAEVLGENISAGIVITKYFHSQGTIPKFKIYEAAHPLPDENSILATSKIIDLISNLSSDDMVLFLLSGGGSALLEKPLNGVTLSQIQNITKQLIKTEADIDEINVVRKHLSAVKGGRLAKIISPAKILMLALSDVVTNRVDSIASGPVVADKSRSENAFEIIDKQKIKIDENIRATLLNETPKNICNSKSVIIGSVKTLCQNAARIAEELGFKTEVISTTISLSVKEMAKIIAQKAQETIKSNYQSPLAYIWGGETVLKVSGSGLGGRNQELAFTITKYIQNMENIAVLAIGSDGTDGPSDAAGGVVDGYSYHKIADRKSVV